MKEKAYLNQFVKCIFEDNYSDADANLKNSINEKIKNKMKTYMVEKKYVPSEDGDDQPFEKIKHFKKKGKDLKDKENKPKRGGKRD